MGKLPKNFQEYFVTNNFVHQFSTRSKNNFHIAVVNSSIGQRCSVYRGSKYWNELPDYLKSDSSVFDISFKQKTDEIKKYQTVFALEMISFVLFYDIIKVLAHIILLICCIQYCCCFHSFAVRNFCVSYLLICVRCILFIFILNFV